MTHIVLTSNFPRPGNERVATCLHGAAGLASIAWIATRDDAARFAEARAEFAALGFDGLRPFASETTSAIYLSGGNPLDFRAALRSTPLRRSLLGATLILGASGGAMQLTPNLSLYRLLAHGVSQVLDERAEYEAMGLVPFEMLPHVEQQTPNMLAAVRAYSKSIEGDIWCLTDGAAVVQEADGSIVAIGDARCLRGGVFV